MIDHTSDIDSLLKRLFPITRSITGEGNRETLRMLQEIIPLMIIEYPSGKNVYDWVVPEEWNIRDAWIKNSRGEKVIDFSRSNLHVVSYSTPIHMKTEFKELQEHLHYLEDLPDAIPYRTSYYKKDWGFCLSFNDLQKYFKEGEEYEIFIDSELSEGSLSAGELLIKGRSSKEFIISTYICHPSLANDNLSGVILTAFLAGELMKMDLNYSYRIIFIPETIGAVAYCAENSEKMKEVLAGLVVTTVGGPGGFGYKQSHDKRHFINRAVEDVLKENGLDFITYPFDIHGSDERQYSSQGFRINTATICKDKYYEYDRYHTSMDDLDFVKAEYINESLNIYMQTVKKIDSSIIYKSKYPDCELMLSRHGLYPKIGGAMVFNEGGSSLSESDIILWLLFYCDGSRTIEEISGLLKVPKDDLLKTAGRLKEKGILESV